MRAGGRDAQPDALGALRELAADVADLALELGDVGADLRADLDDRLVELALDLVAERGALDASSSETCERSSQVSGSTIWNSSSTPMVKACAITGS